tara:strand:+ start:64471 stop:65538 length:1068 start_codon:yes stop_codon:yes gene_type:complete
MAHVCQGFTVSNELSLANLGWQPFFQQQLSLDEWQELAPARVVEQHRSAIEVATASGHASLPVVHSMPALTVGDWVLLDGGGTFLRALERKSCFRRRAAGAIAQEQLLAANVDVALIVCSLNDDFNLNRIERYLSVVNNADAEPVIVLSKSDLCRDPEAYRAEVQKLDSMLCVELVNNLADGGADVLRPWCRPGKTVVLLGSSGAGKSTLANTLLGQDRQSTGVIRESDAKGKHTTTRRSLIAMSGGAMILDTPGMRELQLADCEQGVATTFADIEELARNCRFGDCAHNSEPGCAVRTAIDAGELEERRYLNYCKLAREQALNTASLAERRAAEKKRGRYYKTIQRESRGVRRD